MLKKQETLFSRRFGEPQKANRFRHVSPARLLIVLVLAASVIVLLFPRAHQSDHAQTLPKQAVTVDESNSVFGEGLSGTSVAQNIGTSPPIAAVTKVATTAQAAAATSAPQIAAVSPDELLEYEPNELGVIPVLEYHVITTSPEEEAQFVRTADNMRADLEWLYEHNFYIVPLRDVVRNTISVPAGKHPVALTFDDGSSTQFSFIENESGELVPDPNTAIGILEQFSADHPDFGRGGHFAILINNALAWPDESQMPYFDQKIQWMVEHGYEIGNHTMHHTNLTDISNSEFKMTVAEPMIWTDEIVGDRPENVSRILTLPYGTMPDAKKHGDQLEAMRKGFSYQGQRFTIEAALLVGADPAPSPASTQWDPMMIPRIQMFKESVDFWFGMFESGGVVLYTSDGNPNTITVSQPLPPMLEGHLDVKALEKAGKQVVQYDPETGEMAISPGSGIGQAVLLRRAPNTLGWELSG